MNYNNIIKKVIKNVLPYGIVSKFRPSTDTHVYSEYSHIAPTIYNETGEKLRVFYLQDRGTEHVPYMYGMQNYGKQEHIWWDRFNYYLDTHFYVDSDIFDLHGKPIHLFAALLECDEVIPEIYDRIFEKPDYMKQFEAIFTTSDRVLHRFSNAHFVPISLWYGGIMGGRLDDNRVEKKKNNISMIASGKNFTSGHRFRQKIAWKYKDDNRVDTFGGFDGGAYVSREIPFDNY